MAPFMDLVAAWRSLEPRLMGRIDSLGRGPNQQGTLEDFKHLADVVDLVLRDLSRSVLPLPLHVVNACIFVKLWERRDRLGEEFWMLARIYASGFSDVAEEQVAYVRDAGLGSASASYSRR